MLVWLFLIGVLTYIIVQRRVASITRTPVWLLWLVMMTPVFVWTGWILVNGEDAQMPLVLLLGPFIICPVLYYCLIQWGRIPQPIASAQEVEPVRDTLAAVVDKKPPLRPVDRQEEAEIHTCFPLSIYFLQDIEYHPQALICKGKLRTSPEVAYQTIRENVEAKFGDRFLIMFQEGLNGKPFFALVPNPQVLPSEPVQSTPITKSATESENLAIPIGLLIVTFFTTTWAGAALASSSLEEWQLNWRMIPSGLPYAVSLLAILGLHELAHYLAARRYHVRSTFPYFIPIPYTPVFPFGTFGAIIKIRSPIPNRRALFDIGIAGPIAGFVIALPILLWGLAHSTPTELTDASGLLNFESFQPSASLLVALLSKLALGSRLTTEVALDLHPVAIAGCLGVVVTALNLMPVGQLDGGHIVHAMFGQRTGAMIGQVARILILALSFAQQEFFLLAILLFFIPVVDTPTLNDVSELDNRRDFLGLLALALLIIIILPAPPVLTQLLF